MREPAPPYLGEGPPAISHASGDFSIGMLKQASRSSSSTISGPLWDEVISSTVELSGMRLRNLDR